MDVDIAIASAPVNILSLIDDTDFKSRETSVAYNAAGMDLVWNFTTTAGVTTQTAVTPTTSGNYDWTNLGDGMYAIEMPASGGASINNDTEGVGWFTGIATGVLPWRGPTIGFRAAALNNSLIDAGTTGLLAPTTAARTLDVTATGEAGIDWSNIGAPTTTVNLSGTSTLALEPTTAGRKLDVTTTGEAGIDWANIGAPTTTVNLSGTTIATTQKVDIETIKTNPVVNGGTITFPTTATLASTTNITAGTITTVSGNVTGSVGSVVGAVGSVTGAVGSVTGNVGGNVVGSVGSVTGSVGGNVTGSVGSVAAGGIAAASFAAGAIDATAIASNAIAAAKIASGAITAAKFAASAIDAAALATDAVNEIRDAVFARTYGTAYGSFTFEQITEITVAAVAGILSGAATTNVLIKNLDNSATVIDATVDANGNRSAVTLTP